jgi:hypothetical protein
MLRRNLAVLALTAALAACGSAESRWAPDDAVSRAKYVHDGPPAVTLFTVIGVDSKGGAHSGLMINGSQRLMFDPAGSWFLPRLAERNDVHFGMTDKMVNFYIDYHSRKTYYVVEQTKIVTPEVAELLIQRVLSYGAVPKAQCTKSVSSILVGVPGFESIRQTWFPNNLMRQFAELPGVTERTITDDDDDNNHGILLVQADDMKTPLP